MNRTYPIPGELAVFNILTYIILTIITCGIYGLVWQYRQFRIINAWLGREEYNFWKWFFLSIITCSIYNIYIEYKFAQSIVQIQRDNDYPVSDSLPIVALLLTIFGLSIVIYAIEQSEINSWYAIPESVDGMGM